MECRLDNVVFRLGFAQTRRDARQLVSHAHFTVNIIKDGKLAEKRQLKLPERITNVIRCKNPRCITSVEQELPQIFTLTDEETRTYRCLYCETKAEK